MLKKIAATAAAATAALTLAFAAPASADPGNGEGPNCRDGQLTAAFAQLNGENVNVGQFAKHAVYAVVCLVGVPPGQVNN